MLAANHLLPAFGPNSLQSEQARHRLRDKTSLDPDGPFDERHSLRRIARQRAGQGAQQAAFQIRFLNKFQPSAIRRYGASLIATVTAQVTQQEMQRSKIRKPLDRLRSHADGLLLIQSSSIPSSLIPVGCLA